MIASRSASRALWCSTAFCRARYQTQSLGIRPWSAPRKDSALYRGLRTPNLRATASQTSSSSSKWEEKSSFGPLEVQRIPCLSDNYAWLIRDQDSAKTAVVDPSEAGEVAMFSIIGTLLYKPSILFSHTDDILHETCHKGKELKMSVLQLPQDQSSKLCVRGDSTYLVKHLL